MISTMGLTRFRGDGVICFLSTILCLLFGMATANVVLIGKNVSLSFDDIESNFAPSIKESGECGVLSVAEPLDACSPLTNKVIAGPSLPFALILRGGCTFDEKVRSAQKAGFKAAIVYDNEDSGVLVAMAGTSGEIKIPAIFVSKASGEVLSKYAGRVDVELWIIPTFENSAWSIMAISLICILTISAALATCFFVRRHRIRRERPRNSHAREFNGMSSRLVKAMPSLIFTSVLEDNCTSITCAICLEDYSVGEKLRVLPCRHKFHACCVDSWLTTWRTFCPVCKQDARTSTGNPPASESTPLLSASPASSSSAIGLSSFHSSISATPAIRIVPTQSASTSRTHSLSSTSHAGYSLRSYGNNSPALSISRSSADPRNTSSHISQASHLMSSYSLGFPLSSPITSRYASPYVPSSSNASPSYLIASSSRQPAPLSCSESAASLSPFASAQSLPGC